jgi:hypothetical protein
MGCRARGPDARAALEEGDKVKFLYAFILAIVIAATIPLTALAAGTVYMTTIFPTTQYSGGARVEIDASGTIDPTDTQGYETVDILGYLDPNQGSPLVESGIYVDYTGMRLYFYTTGTSFACGTGAVKAFSGHGCLLTIPNFSSSQTQRILFEDDYEASIHQWVFWSFDGQGTWREIANYTTTTTVITGVEAQAAVTYYQAVNPFYLIDAEFLHPQGWVNNVTLPRWFDYTDATVSVSGTSVLDIGVCPTQYGIIPSIGDTHKWTAGSTNLLGLSYAQQAVCNGKIWSSSTNTGIRAHA